MISTMFQSATILLREGLEAMLVIAALAAYIQKAGMHHRLRELYVGSMVAVAASFLAAWLFEIFNNGVHNDLLEGVTILAAAALMLYVSGWLLLRQDPRSWQQFLRAKADEAYPGKQGSPSLVSHSLPFSAKGQKRSCSSMRSLSLQAAGVRD